MWGLDRVNAKKGLDQKYTWTVDGSNVDCYVVDTGIMASHHEFEGRIIQGASFIQNEDTDLHGHGSHVAAIMAGASYGVAKNCSIIPVKIFNRLGRGSFTTIIAGLSWIAESVKQRKKPSVVNMSLGGPKTQTLNDAVKALVDLGIVVVVAAGNSNSDACEFSPASEPSVITVGATNKSDIRAKFSNYGQCLDVFAPGEDIKSAGVSDANASAIMSGTSMATPFVAGVAALYLSANQSGTAASFAEVLKKTATADAIEVITVH
ncbi:peptidase S8/S53 domain-containing protein [Paraphysoderma sedebokerense]|nr:peptidase S8/S53 domain-containing protein [Paraphysoderma sedebokerense]